LASFNNAFHTVDYSLVELISNTFYDKFITGELDRVEIFYNKFINVMRQEPTLFPLLPISPIVKLESDKHKSKNYNYIFEPNKSVIFETLIAQYLDVNI
jgi:F-type H+-transporting ATPase subunit gamma